MPPYGNSTIVFLTLRNKAEDYPSPPNQTLNPSGITMTSI